MRQYHDLIQRVLDEGRFKGDRTGTGTYSVFGHQMRFDLQEGFPLVTTKKVHWSSVVHELLWFLEGDTNIAYLKENNVKIWDAWATEDGELGPIYGAQWRSWSVLEHDPMGGFREHTIDQIAEAVHLLRTKPDSRRIIVSAWNPTDLPDESVSPQANVENGKMALAACHTMFQFYSAEATLIERHDWAAKHRPEDHRRWYIDRDRDGLSLCERFERNEDWMQFLTDNGVPVRILSCQLYQRSADLFLGVPFNIASYALLTHMMAQVTGHMAGDFVHTFGDAHIYQDHLEQVKLQLSREFRSLPQIKLNPTVKEIDDFIYEDIELIGYDPHPLIRAQVSV